MRIRGEVVRVRTNLPRESQGIGVRFLYLPGDWRIRQKLDEFLSLRFSPRYRVSSELRFQIKGDSDRSGEFSGRLFNIASGGLYIESATDVPLKTRLRINLPRRWGDLQLLGVVCWTNPRGEFGKQSGFGVDLRFIDKPLRFRLWLWRLRLFAPVVR